MASKSDLIRAVLAELPDASAPEIADEVRSRYGVTVAVGSVRAVKSRDGARGGAPAGSAAVRYRERREPARDERDRARVPSRVPRDVQPRLPELEPAAGDGQEHQDQGERYLFALLDRVCEAITQATAGRAQQVSGDAGLIANIAAILDDPQVRADYPPYEYAVTDGPGSNRTLRLYSPDLERLAREPVMARGTIPAVITDVPRSRGQRRERAAAEGCEFCNRQPGFSTPALYRVSGGALGPRTRILCAMHAVVEAAGFADVKPYRIPGGIYTPAGVIEQPKTPMQMLRELARSVMSPDHAEA